jgi:putative glycerol-1-phosphate prenyltransferase
VIALFDPDRLPLTKAANLSKYVCNCGVRAILVGTSLLVSPHFDDFLNAVKKNASCPVILFPGGSQQISRFADAIFFLSLLSGRNPQFLVGEQVKAVFLIKHYGLEVIPVGYILIESGNCTAVEFISNTKPIPRSKPEIAVAHALAGQYLGMKYIYLEAGSGADRPVPEKTVKDVKKNTTIPLIVGGGIRTIKDAQQIVNAGADYVVLGSIIERSPETFKRITKSVNG